MVRIPPALTLLVLLALSTRTAAGRALLGGHGGASASEAALLAQQQEELAALIQQGQADIAKQVGAGAPAGRYRGAVLDCKLRPTQYMQSK